MTRPALADFVAVHAADARTLVGHERRLREAGFAEISRAVGGWLLAVQPLPDSAADGAALRDAGFVFAEGRERVLPSASRAEVAGLGALLERAPTRLDTLPGDFTFVRLGPSGSAELVRSAAGRVPLYFHAGVDQVAIASRFGDLVRVVPPTLGLDPLVAACWTWLEPAFPSGRSFLRGTRALPAGCFARIAPGEEHVRRYWEPMGRVAPLPSPRSRREHAAELRERLLAYLRRELDPTGGNLLTLSGGVDSSVLAALIRGPLGLPLDTLSFVPPKRHPAHSRELGYIAPLVQSLGVGHAHYVTAEEPTLAAILGGAPDVAIPMAHIALAHLPTLKAEHPVKVFIAGEWADDLLGGPQRLPDWAAQVPLTGLVTRSLPTGPRDVGRVLKHRALRWLGHPMLGLPAPLPALFAPSVREEHADWVADERRRLLAKPEPLQHFAALVSKADWIALHWETLSELGVRRAWPFWHRELIELCASVHPSELFGPGTKLPLRTACRGLVPDRNLDRPDKGHWAGAEADPVVPWGVALPAVLRGVVRPDWLECPPASVRRSERSVLRLLMVFAESLNRRRPPADARANAEVSELVHGSQD